ncbi:hypothetical protein DERP_002242 [Dermatophagoides pteronyssinus]|uniref:Uncharacterized protein n=1 Tax=Dermatophagoides pteronyssinus TaxID=6956 RepID=A0ABQ8JHL1_DERPT|nr:hypothetical protein DERP_002242 [Dermatophagoides pteronyssinus]
MASNHQYRQGQTSIKQIFYKKSDDTLKNFQLKLCTYPNIFHVILNGNLFSVAKIFLPGIFKIEKIKIKVVKMRIDFIEYK